MGAHIKSPKRKKSREAGFPFGAFSDNFYVILSDYLHFM